MNSTVSGNSAASGGGLANANFTRLILAQTLISGNTAAGQGAELSSQGTVIANDFNLFGHGEAKVHFVFLGVFRLPWCSTRNRLLLMSVNLEEKLRWP